MTHHFDHFIHSASKISFSFQSTSNPRKRRRTSSEPICEIGEPYTKIERESPEVNENGDNSIEDEVEMKLSQYRDQINQLNVDLDQSISSKKNLQLENERLKRENEDLLKQKKAVEVENEKLRKSEKKCQKYKKKYEDCQRKLAKLAPLLNECQNIVNENIDESDSNPAN